MKRRLAVTMALLTGATIFGVTSPADAATGCYVRASWGWTGNATYRIQGTWPVGPNNFRYRVHWGVIERHITTFNTVRNPVSATRHGDAREIEGWANGLKCASWYAPGE